MPLPGRLGALVFALAVFMSFAAAPNARAAVNGTICLFTDYGGDDPYVAQLKGAILTIDPNARLVDLIHSVEPFNITEGAYLLDQCATEFPAGTIIVAVVDPQVGTPRDPVLVETNKGNFYVGPDNGLFSRVIQKEGLMHAWRLDKPEFFRPGDPSHTFHGRDIFGPVAAHLAAGVAPETMGTELKTLEMNAAPEPSFNGGMIATQVLHIDRYGNIILNLKTGSDLAAKFKQGTLVRITAGHENYSAPLVKTYGDVDKGRLLVVFGSSDQLEISVNQGSAAAKIHVEPGATVFLKP